VCVRVRVRVRVLVSIPSKNFKTQLCNVEKSFLQGYLMAYNGIKIP